MTKKQLYFFQVNYPYGKSAHLPYTAGQLLAYAFSDEDIKTSFSAERIFFLREKIPDVLEKIDEPAVVAFSSYIWNYNYNLQLAEKIKSLYPDCIIIFGGHHVSPGDRMIEEYPFVDYLLHGEGEIIFRRLLRSVLGLEKAEDIPGISMRTEKGIITNPEMISSECNFPSPYLEGYFDKIIEENPDIEFMGLIETSRGCPNSCAYCDWSNMKSKIRKFPMERILGEIEWMSKNRICVLGSADSNFGLFERDEEITDKIVEEKLKTGHPLRFQTSYAKNSTKRVFDIGMKLERADMNRGITLSFQSMNKAVLKNIGRENISTEYYSELMRLYNEAGVATYTELILGLPGETYESLTDGMDELLSLGQHNSIYIHNCEWLPCSIMGRPDFVEKYGIRTARIPLNQPHREPDEDDNITEYSQVVISTLSMTAEEWKKMNLFSYAVQAFHHMGLLQFFALYLFNEKICSYKTFYTSLLDFFLSHKNTVGGRIFSKIDEYLNDVIEEKGTLSCCDELFGKVQWPFEEYAFLKTVYELDGFYEEISVFLKRFGIREDIFDALLDFQKRMIKTPKESTEGFETDFDFPQYFNAVLNSHSAVLNKEKTTVRIKPVSFSDWEEYAKVIAWYGRKNGIATHMKDFSFGAGR